MTELSAELRGPINCVNANVFLHSRNCATWLFLDLQFCGGIGVCVPKNRGPKRLRTKLPERRSTQKGGEPFKPADDIATTLSNTHSNQKILTRFNLAQMAPKLSREIFVFL